MNYTKGIVLHIMIFVGLIGVFAFPTIGEVIGANEQLITTGTVFLQIFAGILLFTMFITWGFVAFQILRGDIQGAKRTVKIIMGV